MRDKITPLYNSFQSSMHLLPEFRNGLSWAPAFGLTSGSAFPCCSQYCINSLAHCESFIRCTFSSRRNCSTKVRWDCKSLLLLPDGITVDIFSWRFPLNDTTRRRLPRNTCLRSGSLFIEKRLRQRGRQSAYCQLISLLLELPQPPIGCYFNER